MTRSQMMSLFCMCLLQDTDYPEYIGYLLPVCILLCRLGYQWTQANIDSVQRDLMLNKLRY